MSIAAMMSQVAAGDAAKRRTRQADNSDPQTAVAAVASELARYIPIEAVAPYTAILPFLVSQDTPLADQDYTSRWLLAGIVAVLAVGFAVGFYRREVVARGGTFRWPIGRTALVITAYVGWVLVIPGSPFADFGWYTPANGAIAGILITTAISLGDLWSGQGKP